MLGSLCYVLNSSAIDHIENSGGSFLNFAHYFG